MKSPRVSIIILNYNGLNDTLECINSLRELNYDNYEVIVVDNGSKGNDADVMEKEFGDYVRVIRNKKNYGFAEGNNIAIRMIIDEGRSEYIYILNNDTIVTKDVLIEGIKPFLTDPKIGSVSTKTLDYYDRDKINTVGIELTYDGAAAVRGIFCNANNPRYNSPKYIFGATGCSVIYRVKALEDIILPKRDYFDSDYFCYNEDTDLAWRLQLAGWRCFYQPTAIVYHKHSVAGGKYSPFKIYFGQRNRNWTVYKNFPVRYILYSYPYYILKISFWFLHNLITTKKIRSREFGRNTGYFKIAMLLIKAFIDAHKEIGKVFAKRRYITTYIRKISDCEIKSLFQMYRVSLKTLLLETT